MCCFVKQIVVSSNKKGAYPEVKLIDKVLIFLDSESIEVQKNLVLYSNNRDLFGYVDMANTLTSISKMDEEIGVRSAYIACHSLIVL